ncbi:hypothetical protein [Maridesulfovibrio bastinii]|uniref:hypothetical protein n=1 Tax=Maridesulfovibrio bastinii TaxID=47157 RepID=UPI000485D3F2|nr:hypothetical protein [Maridesulfovibrio bastinii]
MRYFLGNCQMDFLNRAMADRDAGGDYRVLASPVTYCSSPGTIPHELAEVDKDSIFDDYCYGRNFRNQFEMIGNSEAYPSLVVMNLFHENSPLFIHNKDKYIFFTDPKIWQKYPDIEAWMKGCFGMIRVNPATYLKRYHDMLKLFMERFNDVPLILIKRLSHYPAFGPAPYSYLEGWDSLWQSAAAIIAEWSAEFRNLHVIELDKIFAGIWNGSEKIIESHCPFLKFEIKEENDRITDLHASRDVEHIGSMWPVLADKILAFEKTGKISYTAAEQIPEEWSSPWKPEFPERNRMLEMLSSGANYLCARAVGAFFIDLNTDYTDLLVETGAYTPVCHNTLHMIKIYGRIHRNPALTIWCEEHRKTALNFTANGALYQQDYLNRLDEIERFAAGDCD